MAVLYGVTFFFIYLTVLELVELGHTVVSIIQLKEFLMGMRLLWIFLELLPNLGIRELEWFKQRSVFLNLHTIHFIH